MEPVKPVELIDLSDSSIQKLLEYMTELSTFGNPPERYDPDVPRIITGNPLLPFMETEQIIKFIAKNMTQMIPPGLEITDDDVEKYVNSYDFEVVTGGVDADSGNITHILGISHAYRLNLGIPLEPLQKLGEMFNQVVVELESPRTSEMFELFALVDGRVCSYVQDESGVITLIISP